MLTFDVLDSEVSQNLSVIKGDLITGIWGNGLDMPDTHFPLLVTNVDDFTRSSYLDISVVLASGRKTVLSLTTGDDVSLIRHGVPQCLKIQRTDVAL